MDMMLNEVYIFKYYLIYILQKIYSVWNLSLEWWWLYSVYCIVTQDVLKISFESSIIVGTFCLIWKFFTYKV